MIVRKFTAVITAACFLFSFVFAPTAQALSEKTGESVKRALAGNIFIPPAAGRVLNAKSFGSGTVVVNIQDLHCHPEVQRNISRILSALDGRFSLDEVYVEGGYGDVDTSRLCVADETLRKNLVETLVEQGRLTGAEYYSITSNRPRLLKGIEDREVHQANLVRLGTIMERKERYERQLKALSHDLAYMQAKYMGFENRKFNELAAAYRNGEIDTDRYYAMLDHYVKRINARPERYNASRAIRAENYPDIALYRELSRLGREINYRRVSSEFQGFMNTLKERLPYKVYNDLREQTEGFTRLDELYAYLAVIARDPSLEVPRRYPDLALFFDYTEKSRKLNPRLMIEEERRLVEDIRLALSRDIAELEVSFLDDLFGYFQGYLLTRLAADDYDYFTKNFDRFRELWAAYAVKDRMPELEGDLALLAEYYRVNCERNLYFLGNMPDIKDAAPGRAGSLTGPAAVDEITGKADQPDLIVVVTGGFHTPGIEQLLEERRISYVTVMPSVTKDTTFSDAAYSTFACQQASILSNSLALGLATQFPDKDIFDLLLKTAARDLKGAEFSEKTLNDLVARIGEATGMEDTRLVLDEAKGEAVIVLAGGDTVVVKKDAAGEIALSAGESRAAMAAKASAAALASAEKVLSASNTLANAVEMIPAGYPALKNLFTFAVRNGLIPGDGLVYRIASDPAFAESVDGVPAELVAGFPERVQEMMAEHVRRADALDAAAKRSAALRIMLGIDLARDFLLAMDAAAPDNVDDLIRLVSASDVSREALDADVIMICGNDDLRTLDEAIAVFNEGKARAIMVTGGVGRGTPSFLRAVFNRGIKTVELIPGSSEKTLDLDEATLADWDAMFNGKPEDRRALLELLRSRGVSEALIIKALLLDLAREKKIDLPPQAIITETASTTTPENFTKASPILRQMKTELGRPVRLAYAQKPIQQLRAKATFNAAFAGGIDSPGDIIGISYTVDVNRGNALVDPKTGKGMDPLLPMIGEFWRLILYSAVGDIMLDPALGLKALGEENWSKLVTVMQSYPDQAALRKALLDLADGVKSRLSGREALEKILGEKGQLTTGVEAVISWVYGEPARETRAEEQKPAERTVISILRDWIASLAPADERPAAAPGKPVFNGISYGVSPASRPTPKVEFLKDELVLGRIASHTSRSFTEDLAGAEILVIGPGSGSDEIEDFIRLYPGIKTIHVVDANDFVIKKVRSGLEEKGLAGRVRFYNADARDLPAELSGKIDMVFAGAVFDSQYFTAAQQGEAAGSIGRVLKNGGAFVSAVYHLKPKALENTGLQAVPVDSVMFEAAVKASPSEYRETLPAIRAHYAALAGLGSDSDSESILKALPPLQRQQMRRELLGTYGLLKTDGSLDYDRFYEHYVMKASNSSKENWLKDYEAVTVFIDEIEYGISDQEIGDFAFAIHDNGYWRERHAEIGAGKVTRGEHMLLGRLPVFSDAAAESEFTDFLTADGKKKYDDRFTKSGGYKITLADINPARWQEFYDYYGARFGVIKDVKEFLSTGFNPGKLQVFNANAGSWTALLDDCAFFDNLDVFERAEFRALVTREEKEAYLGKIGKTARLNTMRSNQKAAMASAFALTKVSRELSFAQMDYATAVVWRYKGHWSGKDGWEQVYQVRTDYYSHEFDADRWKDGPIWQAVLDRQLELQGVSNPYERFFRVVLTRTTNESKFAFISSFDAVANVVAGTRRALYEDMKADPRKFSRLAQASHDLGYWPGVEATMRANDKPALGRLPVLSGEQLDTFLSFLTGEGRGIYENRFKDARGYKLLVRHIIPEQRKAFFEFMQTLYGIDKSGVISNPGVLREKDQIFNANYGSWQDIEKDLPSFDREAGAGKRLDVMMKNQEANIIMTRIIGRADSLLSAMQMSHSMAVLWRYVVGDYQGEYAYDGKDRYGRPDPEGWRDGSAQVGVNYYDESFATEREKDYEMWISVLRALAEADGAGSGRSFFDVVVRRATNESKLAWRSTYRAIVRQVDEIEKNISRSDLEKYAPRVHDNGYWAGEKGKITDPDNPFLGSHLDLDYDEAAPYLKEGVIDWLKDRSKPQPAGLKRGGTRGYQFTAGMFKDDAALKAYYRSIGKSDKAIAKAGEGGVILNENAMSFEDALKQAQLHGPESSSRIDIIYNNQKQAIATALLFTDLDLTVEEMAYYTAVIWRYKGHWDGENGYDSVWQVSADYLMGLDRAEREKDISVLLAVYDVLGKKPRRSNFKGDPAVPQEVLNDKGIPRGAVDELDLTLKDRIYLKINGKWYAGTIIDYQGDGLLDGRPGTGGTTGTAIRKAGGFMVSLDNRVPDVFMPPNGVFITNAQLEKERNKPVENRNILTIENESGYNNARPAPLTLASNRVLSNFLRKIGIRFAPLIRAAMIVEEIFITPFTELGEFTALLALKLTDQAGYDRAAVSFIGRHGYAPGGAQAWEARRGLENILTRSAGRALRAQVAMALVLKASLILGHMAHNFLKGTSSRENAPLSGIVRMGGGISPASRPYSAMFLLRDELIAESLAKISPVFRNGLAGAEVLIVGPGYGSGEIEEMIRLFPSLETVHVVDVNSGVLNRIEAMLKPEERTKPKIRLYNADARDLPVELTGKVDLIYAGAVFDDTYFTDKDQKAAAQGIFRTLKDGGTFLSAGYHLPQNAFEGTGMRVVPVNLYDNTPTLFRAAVKPEPLDYKLVEETIVQESGASGIVHVNIMDNPVNDTSVDRSQFGAIYQALNDGKIVALSLADSKRSYAYVRWFFSVLATYLYKQFDPQRTIMNVHFVLLEMMNNAFVHGNRLDQSRPIYLQIDMNSERKVARIFNVVHYDAIPVKEWNAASIADLHGFHAGVDAMKTQKQSDYDDYTVPVTNQPGTSIFVAEARSIHDSAVSKADSRALTLPSSYITARAIFRFFGWKPVEGMNDAALEAFYARQDRVAEFTLVPFALVLDIIAHTFRLFIGQGGLNKYRGWGAAAIWTATASAALVAGLALHAGAGWIVLAAYLANAITHAVYNLLFGSSTMADSPLANEPNKVPLQEFGNGLSLYGLGNIKGKGVQKSGVEGISTMIFASDQGDIAVRPVGNDLGQVLNYISERQKAPGGSALLAWKDANGPHYYFRAGTVYFVIERYVAPGAAPAHRAGVPKREIRPEAYRQETRQREARPAVPAPAIGAAHTLEVKFVDFIMQLKAQFGLKNIKGRQFLPGDVDGISPWLIETEQGKLVVKPIGSDVASVRRYMAFRVEAIREGRPEPSMLRRARVSEGEDPYVVLIANRYFVVERYAEPEERPREAPTSRSAVSQPLRERPAADASRKVNVNFNELMTRVIDLYGLRSVKGRQFLPDKINGISPFIISSDKGNLVIRPIGMDPEAARRSISQRQRLLLSHAAASELGDPYSFSINGMYFVVERYSSASKAILPENIPLVERLMSEGRSPLQIAFTIALKELFAKLDPWFILRHDDKRGAAQVILSGAAGAVGIGVTLAVLGIAPVLACAAGLFAGGVATTAVHVSVDKRYIETLTAGKDGDRVRQWPATADNNRAQKIVKDQKEIQRLLGELRQLKTDGWLDLTLPGHRELIVTIARSQASWDALKKGVRDELLWVMGKIRGDPALDNDPALTALKAEIIRNRLASDPSRAASLLEEMGIGDAQRRELTNKLKRVTMSEKTYGAPSGIAAPSSADAIEEQVERTYYYRHPYSENLRGQIRERLQSLDLAELENAVRELVRERAPNAKIKAIVLNGSYLYSLRGLGVSDLDVMAVVENDTEISFNDHDIPVPRPFIKGQAAVRTNMVDLAIKTEDYFNRELASQALENRTSLEATLWATGIVIYGSFDMRVPTSQQMLVKIRQLARVAQDWLDGKGSDIGEIAGPGSEAGPAGQAVPREDNKNLRYSKAAKRLIESMVFFQNIYGDEMDENVQQSMLEIQVRMADFFNGHGSEAALRDLIMQKTEEVGGKHEDAWIQQLKEWLELNTRVGIIADALAGNVQAPRAILSENIARVNRWAAEGRSPLSIAVRVTVREFLASVFTPRSFIAQHPDEAGKKGARSVVLGGVLGAAAGLALGAAAVFLGAAPVLLAAAFAAGLFAGNAATHVYIDWHYVKASGLADAVRDFGAAAMDGNGDLSTNIYFMDSMPENPSAWGLRNTGMNVNGKPVWASTRLGALVLFAETRDPEGVLRELGAAVNGKGLVAGNARLVARLKDLLSSLKIETGNAGFAPSITIDHSAPGRPVGYNTDGTMTVGADLFRDGDGAFERPVISERLGELSTIRNAEAVATAQNVGFRLDKVRKFKELDACLNNLTNVQIVVDASVFEGVDAGMLKERVTLARRNGVSIYVESSRDGALDLGKLGFAGRAAIQGRSVTLDGFMADNPVSGESIEGYRSVSELRGMIRGSGASFKLFNMSEVAGLVNGGERPIIGRVDVLEVFKTNILGLFNKSAVDAEYVTRVARAWDRDKLPPLPEDIGGLVDAAANGQADDIIAAIGRGDLPRSVAAYLAKLSGDIGEDAAKAAELRKVFLRTLVERALAKARLDAEGKHTGLVDDELEILLGRKLLSQALLPERETRDPGLLINPETFIRSDISAEEGFALLGSTARNLKDDARPEAIRTVIELIARCGEARIASSREKTPAVINSRSIHALLGAA